MNEILKSDAGRGMGLLRDDELNAVSGAASPFVNEGCIVISKWLPLPTYNPWLDPYSPERRSA